MKLIANWREVLRYAWSIRLMLIAGLLSGLEVALPLFHEAFPLDRGVFAFLSMAFTAAAFVSRLVAQRNTQEGAPDTQQQHYEGEL